MNNTNNTNTSDDIKILFDEIDDLVKSRIEAYLKKSLKQEIVTIKKIHNGSSLSKRRADVVLANDISQSVSLKNIPVSVSYGISIGDTAVLLYFGDNMSNGWIASLITFGGKDLDKYTYKFSEIQDTPTTLDGYGIKDAYTKDEVYSKQSTYTKQEIINLINDLTTTLNNSINTKANLATPTIELSTSTTLTPSHFGKQILYNNANAINFTLPDATSSSLIINSEVIITKMGNGDVNIINNNNPNSIIISPSGYKSLRTRYTSCHIKFVKKAGNVATWLLTGGLE